MSPSATSKHSLSLSRVGAPTTSLGSPIQCLTARKILHYAWRYCYIRTVHRAEKASSRSNSCTQMVCTPFIHACIIHVIIIQPWTEEISKASKCKNRKGSMLQVLQINQNRCVGYHYETKWSSYRLKMSHTTKINLLCN